MSAQFESSNIGLAKIATDALIMNTTLSPEPSSPTVRLGQNRHSKSSSRASQTSDSSAGNSTSALGSDSDDEDASASSASASEEDEDDSDEEAVSAPSEQDIPGQAGRLGNSSSDSQSSDSASDSDSVETFHVRSQLPVQSGEDDNDDAYRDVDNVSDDDDDDDVRDGEETLAAIQSQFPDKTIDELVVVDDLATADPSEFSFFKSIHEHATAQHDPHAKAALKNLGTLEQALCEDTSPTCPSTPVAVSDIWQSYTSPFFETQSQTIDNPCRILPASMMVGGYIPERDPSGNDSDSDTDDDLPPEATHRSYRSAIHKMLPPKRKPSRRGRAKRRAARALPAYSAWSINPRSTVGFVYENSTELDIRPPTRGQGPYTPAKGSTWYRNPKITGEFATATTEFDTPMLDVNTTSLDASFDLPLPSVELDDATALDNLISEATVAPQSSSPHFALPDFVDANAFKGLRFDEANSDHESEDIDCGLELEDLIELDSDSSVSEEDARCLKLWATDPSDEMEGLETANVDKASTARSASSHPTRPQLPRRDHSGLSLTKPRTRAAGTSSNGKRKATEPLSTAHRPVTRQCR